jgi:alpha-galactosidase
VWFSRDGDGGLVVTLFNLDAVPATVAANWSDLGFSGTALTHDIWSHDTLGKFDGNFSATLPPRGSRLLRIVPLSAEHAVNAHA